MVNHKVFVVKLVLVYDLPILVLMTIATANAGSSHLLGCYAFRLIATRFLTMLGTVGVTSPRLLGTG